MARVAVFAATPLWDVHHAEVIELALREKAAGHDVIVVSCDRFHASCAANPFKTDSLCTDCLSQSRRTRDHFLKEDEGFEHVKLSPRPMRRPVGHRQVSSREQLLGFDYKGAPLGSLVMSQMADEKKDTLFSLQSEADVRRANLLLSSSIDFYDACVQFLLDKKVETCFVWNGRRPSDGPAWWAARSLGVQAFIFISGVGFGRMKILQQSSIQDPAFDRERLVALKHKLVETGDFEGAVLAGQRLLESYRRGRVKAPGWRHHGRGKNGRPRFKGQFVLLLLSSPIEFMHIKAFQDFFLPDPYFWLDEVIQAVAELLPNHEVVVKWHPAQGNLTGHEANLIREKIDTLSGATHFEPQQNVDAYWLAKTADLVFTMGSTVGLWAAVFGKPLFIVGPEGSRFPGGAYRAESKNVKDTVTQTLRKYGGVPPASRGEWGALYFYNRSLLDYRFKHLKVRSLAKRRKVSVKLRAQIPFFGLSVRTLRPRRLLTRFFGT